MNERWLRTDEVEDVAGSIRHAMRALEIVNEDPQAWKWVLLALHSALQGACVCHLTTSASPVGIVSDRNAAEWLTYFEEQRTNPQAKPPKTHIKTLPELLKDVRKPHSAGDRSNVSGVPITDSEMGWLRRFHEDIRNQFIHFAPMGWSIEVSGVPEIAALIARIVGDIVNKDYAFRHQNSASRRAMLQNLKALVKASS